MLLLTLIKKGVVDGHDRAQYHGLLIPWMWESQLNPSTIFLRHEEVKIVYTLFYLDLASCIIVNVMKPAHK